MHVATMVKSFSWCERQTWTFLHQGKNRVIGVVGAS
jgi:hypothetical protein